MIPKGLVKNYLIKFQFIWVNFFTHINKHIKTSFCICVKLKLLYVRDHKEIQMRPWMFDRPLHYAHVNFIRL